MTAGDLIYLVEITAYDDTLPGTTTLRYCSGAGFVTLPSETPASTWFDPRIFEPCNFSRTAFSDARVTGGGSVGFGELVLNNADQGLNGLLDLGIDGRDVIVRVGSADGAYPSAFTTFLTATAEQPEVGARRATIRLRDKLAVLGLPLQASLYGGTNALPAGIDGTASDIKGKPLPLLYGRGYSIEPICVNTSKLIYQFHAGRAVQAVDAVYDRGVALVFGVDRANQAAMEATAPAAGNFDTCLALGLIRLGASPAGRVTMDARGDAVGGYVSSTSDVLKRLLVDQCGIPSGDIDTASFTALATASSAEIGFYAADPMTRQDAVDMILPSIGAWLSPTRLGKWQVGQLVAPSGAAAASFTDDDMISIDRIATNDTERGVAVYRVTLDYKPFWTPMPATETATSLTDARRTELATERRSVAASDAAVQTKHLLAPEMRRQTLLNVAADAATEAARLLALHKVRRDFVKAVVNVDTTTAALDLGAVVTLTTARLGYGAGRSFYVVGIDSNGRTNRLTLDLWG